MIQRKQTVYLFFVIVLFVVSFFIDIAAAGSGDTVYQITVASLYPLAIFASLSILCSIGAIFTFKKTSIQLRLSIVNMVMIFGFIIFEIYSIYRFFNNETISSADKGIGVASFIPIAALIFAFLAFRGISSDIFLLRSYNRMR